MGAVAGIVVGVLVFIALAVIGVVSAILLTCYFKHRHTRYFRKKESEGLENPNYGEVDSGPFISQNQTTAQEPSDYEVPVPSISYSEPHMQEQHQQHNSDSFAQQQHGKPTQSYINIPDRNLTSSLTGSGDYSYVIVGRPQHQPVRPQRSYNSYFPLSSKESSDLPTFAAAELGELTSNYTLMGAD